MSKVIKSKDRDNLRYKVHSCSSQRAIVLGQAEPPAAKCRCRKYINLEQAKEEVQSQRAKWEVIERTYENVKVDCRICHGDPKMGCKSCALCKGVGFIQYKDSAEKYSFNIVMMLASKTPRVPTIEQGHIERWLVEENAQAEDRIEEYGWLSQLVLYELGAEIRERRLSPNVANLTVKPKVIWEGKLEPVDNPETGEGRRYDYGRGV